MVSLFPFIWVLNRDEQQLLEKGKPVEIVVVSKKELPARGGTDYTVEYDLDNKLYSIHVNKPFYDGVKKGDTFEAIQYKGRIKIDPKYHIGVYE
ncbi:MULTISPECIES: hypothetical protein [Bacillus]|uniref:Uncharacterized protein n=1 Tax=Bacillus pseudomycoides TaxID=64104 RepID=A0A1Y3M837_9BACI|nr:MULTISPECIES: hypothetical protein [Bacillus cereus group]EOP50272.1 hypothetical protein IIW_02473 [Bacillus cereus VD136]EOP67502.1 hypothetical protein KOW_04149 [Bacillus cereus VDM006]EOQ02947.1 hypothetical protein KOY_00797 [Bacillus cereus VDM021]OOG90455.1 hypothetical protein BTH41_03176 [Bacillus mycoides]MDF2086270.1 hypothetical protein [Bacillus pseudomycoides]